MTTTSDPQRQGLVPTRSPSGPSRTAAAGLRRFRSEQLFAQGEVEVEIEHQQQVYRLRRTALGKLILTK